MLVRRFLLALMLAAIPLAADTRELNYPAEVAPSGTGAIVIYSTTDIEAAKPLLDTFHQLHPQIAIDYKELDSLELYDRFLEETTAETASADLLLSSAMDLQIKLVNDGYARAFASPALADLPAWANWRNEAFGFTFEPAVIVYNKRLVPPEDVPRTRFDLIELLDDQPETYFGKVATYDPERSGFGFLMVTQDSKASASIWRLANSLGSSGVKLYSNTAAMLDRIASGEFLIGYNLLGSYALARAELEPDIGIVLPGDYTLALSRIAFIPKDARNVTEAEIFLDFLLSTDGQRIVADDSRLYSIHPDVNGEVTAAALRAQVGNDLRPIRVGPGLLVFLDQVKRQKFLRDWRRALGGRLPKGVREEAG